MPAVDRNFTSDHWRGVSQVPNSKLPSTQKSRTDPKSKPIQAPSVAESTTRARLSAGPRPPQGWGAGGTVCRHPPSSHLSSLLLRAGCPRAPRVWGCWLEGQCPWHITRRASVPPTAGSTQQTSVAPHPHVYKAVIERPVTKKEKTRF